MKKIFNEVFAGSAFLVFIVTAALLLVVVSVDMMWGDWQFRSQCRAAGGAYAGHRTCVKPEAVIPLKP